MSHIAVGNFKVVKGRVENTDIDMNFKRITTLGDPVLDYDAVNLRTLQAATGSTVPNVDIEENVTLTGTLKSNINGSGTVGTFLVSAQPITDTNGPSGIYQASKTIAGTDASVNRTSTQVALGSNTTLFIDWSSNQVMQLWKNGPDYDGIYKVTLKPF